MITKNFSLTCLFWYPVHRSDNVAAIPDAIEANGVCSVVLFVVGIGKLALEN